MERRALPTIFLRHAVERLRARGGVLSHLDVTLICEAPKIGPHREAMRARIAEIAGVAVDRCAVKATTSERLGFTGRKEGIACFALATVRLPAIRVTGAGQVSPSPAGGRRVSPKNVSAGTSA